MKFSLSWLKQHLDTTASLNEICDKLTAIGLEVEGVEDPGKALAPFIVAEILEAEQHPNADRLRVCKVSTGKDVLQIVCGAPNARAGIKVVLARPGDVMPDSGEALKKGQIRGIESQGMMCAVDELGIGDEHDGILELGDDAPVGGSFAAYAGYDDPVIEINLTPNRPDCAGIAGIARDLAAAGLGTYKPRDISPVKGAEESRIKVKLDFPAGDKACPHFVGRLIRNIENRPSPEWMQKYLRAVGLRPISALVDITNFLTIDSNRPLHVFDADKIKGDLWVRAATGGERFDALNGKSYEMQAGMSIIGDETGMLSLGGVMGGVSSSCSPQTTNVFIESAFFDAARTALTGRLLGVTSDARYRFERGVDPAFTQAGMELATKLVLELCGTKDTVVSALTTSGAAPSAARTVALKTDKCLRHTGVDVAPDQQTKILSALGFKVETKDGAFAVVPPSWRPDIDGDADLVEEIIRIKGYDALPTTSLDRPLATTQAAIDLQDQRERAARRGFAMQGLMESVTWSFMPSALAAHFAPVLDELRLSNPISSDLDVMRPTVMANLIMAAKRNADRGFADVGLFEVGPVFKNQSPEGQSIVATALRASSTPRHWASPARPVDAFDAKADAVAALTAAGAPTGNLQISTDAPAYYHPGRSGALRLGPVLLAYFGELHPSVLAACDIKGPVVGCELFIAAIPAPRSNGTAKPLLKLESLQAVERDFAFVVARDVTAAKLMKAVKDADKALIRDVSVFDVYEGDKVEAGKKSVAVSVTLQPADKSLTDAEIDAVAAKVTASVAKATGAALRS